MYVGAGLKPAPFIGATQPPDSVVLAFKHNVPVLRDAMDSPALPGVDCLP